MALFQLKEYAKSIESLKLASKKTPKDAEALFTLARSLYEVSSYRESHSILEQLKGNAKWGPGSYLYSGLIHEKSRNWNDAISDYQTAINHKNVQSEIALEAKYRLAEIFNQTHKFSRAFTLLGEINEIAPEYKDVASRMKHYQESNSSLQTYLTAPPDKFIILCRKLTRVAYTGARVTIGEVDTSPSHYIDIMATIRIAHGDNLAIFRYMKTNKEVGVPCLRSLYARSQGSDASRSLCFTPGIYSKEAEHFAGILPIKLIGRQKLTEYLESINLDFTTSQ